jgi:hypothetical protein
MLRVNEKIAKGTHLRLGFQKNTIFCFWNRNHGYWASPWTRAVVADRDFARKAEHTRKAATMDGTFSKEGI